MINYLHLLIAIKVCSHSVSRGSDAQRLGSAQTSRRKWRQRRLRRASTVSITHLPKRHRPTVRASCQHSPGRSNLLTAPPPGFASAVTSAFIATLGANRQSLRAKAAESAAPTRVRWVEAHNTAASHWHEADDVTVGATPSPNANTAADEQHIDRHGTWSPANRCDRHVAEPNPSQRFKAPL